MKNSYEVFNTPLQERPLIIYENDVTIIHSFADTRFKGNPAGVVLMENRVNAVDMVSLVIQMDLPVIVTIEYQAPAKYHIRWFTRNAELQLCGHGTMAASYWLFDKVPEIGYRVHFTTGSGDDLYAELANGLVFLELPALESWPADHTLFRAVEDALGLNPLEVRQADDDLIAVLDNERDVIELEPSISAISDLDSRTLIVTSKTSKTSEFRNYDIVSRVFAPNICIDEDQVCISAHCKLQPYWQRQLNLGGTIKAVQWSANGGSLTLESREGSVLVSGGSRYQLGQSKEKETIPPYLMPTQPRTDCGLKAFMIENNKNSETEVDMPISMAYFEVAPGGCTEPHEHSVAEVWCITTGNGVVVSDGVIKAMSAGQFVYLAPGSSHQLRNSGLKSIKAVSMWWEPRVSCAQK